MTTIFDFLNQYAQLINFVLFATIIWWLFSISQSSRKAIEDKFEALLAAKDLEISNLRERLKKKDEFHQGEVVTLQHNLAFYKHLASLSENERVEAIKLEYELRLQELEEREKIAGAETREEIQEEKNRLKEAAERVFGEIDPATISTVIDLVLKVARVAFY